MNKAARARLAIVGTLDRIYMDIIRAYLENRNLTREHQYASAAGQLERVLGLSTELSHMVQTVITQLFKPIFDAEPEITYTLDEINVGKEKVLKWVEGLKSAAMELQNAL